LDDRVSAIAILQTQVNQAQELALNVSHAATLSFVTVNVAQVQSGWAALRQSLIDAANGLPA
jgi:hypothetical protein